jgi:hypothetical protein
MQERPFQVGDCLYFKTGQRTKDCQDVGESVAAVVSPVTVNPALGTVTLDGRVWQCRHVLLLAQAEGFDSVEAFFSFFGKGIAGQLIGWQSVKHKGETRLTTLDCLSHYWE